MVCGFIARESVNTDEAIDLLPLRKTDEDRTVGVADSRLDGTLIVPEVGTSVTVEKPGRGDIDGEIRGEAVEFCAVDDVEKDSAVSIEGDVDREVPSEEAMVDLLVIEVADMAEDDALVSDRIVETLVNEFAENNNEAVGLVSAIKDVPFMERIIEGFDTEGNRTIDMEGESRDEDDKLSTVDKNDNPGEDEGVSESEVDPENRVMSEVDDVLDV